MKEIKLYPIIFVLSSALLFVFKLSVSQPAHVDEIFFKSPGLSWASGTGWRSQEEPEYGGWQPPLNEVFASYPPVYPFLFGCCVKVFGFTWQVCAGYDALIHIFLSGVLVLFFRSVCSSKPGIAWIAGWLFLLSSYQPRPDQLAMSFGYGALALMFGADHKLGWIRLVFIGCAFGLCLGTSVPCSIALTPLIGALVIGRHTTFGQTFRRFAVIGGVAVATTLIIVMPVWLYHHGALTQNLNATASITSFAFLSSLNILFRYWCPTLIAFGLIMMPGIWAIFAAWKSQDKERKIDWLFWYGAVGPPVVFFFIKSTFQGSYYWFFMPWLVAALFQCRLHGLLFTRKALVLVICGFLPIIALNLRAMLAAELTPLNYRIEAVRQTVEELVPRGASVACGGEYWWLLARRNRVYDLLDNAALQAEQVEYLILTGVGSGAARKLNPLPPFAEGERYQQINSNMDAMPPSIFGMPLSRSTFSPAPAVFRRKDLH